MKTKDRIVQLLSAGKSCTATDLARAIGISRQAVSKHLRGLVTAGLVIKKGATRGTQFRLAKPGEKPTAERWFAKKFPLKGLEEDRTFDEISALLNLRSRLSAEALGILK